MSIQEQKTLHFNPSEISLTTKCYLLPPTPLPNRETNHYILDCDKTQKIPLRHLFFEITGCW